MLISAEHSLLLVIDLQERLAPAIHGIDDILRENISLMQVAKRLDVPVMATEQYPKGLGPTVSAIAEHIPDQCTAQKVFFSAEAEKCVEQLGFGSRSQIVLTGTETHVCVLQTALELRAAGKAVFVVAEATGSRRQEDRERGLRRMRQEGCRIVTREMVIFEWLRRAGTDLFRQISREFLRSA